MQKILVIFTALCKIPRFLTPPPPSRIHFGELWNGVGRTCCVNKILTLFWIIHYCFVIQNILNFHSFISFMTLLNHRKPKGPLIDQIQMTSKFLFIEYNDIIIIWKYFMSLQRIINNVQSLYDPYHLAKFNSIRNLILEFVLHVYHIFYHSFSYKNYRVVNFAFMHICFAKPAVDHAFNLNNYFFMVNGIKISISLILRYFCPFRRPWLFIISLKTLKFWIHVYKSCKIAFNIPINAFRYGSCVNNVMSYPAVGIAERGDNRLPLWSSSSSSYLLHNQDVKT